MKKCQNNYGCLFFSISLFLVFHSCQNEHPEREKNNLLYYLKNYPSYKKHYDTLQKVTRLTLYRDTVKEEELIFNSENILVEYIFYNSIINKPRFSITYFLNGKILKGTGNPLYVASEFFEKDKYATDSFNVQIYLATPPNFITEFSVYKLTNSNAVENVATNAIKDNHIVAFIGKINKQKVVEKYYVVSKMASTLEPAYIRSDTAYFTIKVKHPR